MDPKNANRASTAQTSCANPVAANAKRIMSLLAGSILAVLLLALPAVAQTAATPMPPNASAKSYGDGWECDIGYRRNAEACAAVVVPANAYDTQRAYGLGWACLRGFRVTDDLSCAAVAVPDGAFLDPSGDRWRCLRGYRKIDEGCQEVVLPANSYLSETSYGSEWVCNRGFEASGEICVAIAVPENGYLNTASYGQPWNCERGFFAKGDLCVAVAVPENGYFDDATYGSGWKCSRGFAASGDTCNAIVLPQNAHLDRSGNRWACDMNFQRSKGQCVLSN